MANNQQTNTKKPRKPRNGAFKKVTVLGLDILVDNVKYNISVNHCENGLWTCQTKNEAGFVLEKTPLFKQPNYKDLDGYVKRLVELHEKFGGKASTPKKPSQNYGEVPAVLETTQPDHAETDDVEFGDSDFEDVQVDGSGKTKEPLKLHLPESFEKPSL